VQLGTRAGAQELEGFADVVIAIGSEELRPDVPGSEHAVLSSAAIAAGPQALGSGGDVLIIDDGFGSWRCASAVEMAIAAGVRAITVATPGAAFGATLPPEGRAQLLPRLHGAPLDVRTFTSLEAFQPDTAVLRSVMSGAVTSVSADTVIVVGERRARDWRSLVPDGATIHAIGDAVVPRRVGPAISEGRALAATLSAVQPRFALGAPA
jgi:2,4-dienoyl-CoA reductase (NADPH2)